MKVIIIGRGSQCDVIINDDWMISDIHLQIVKEDGGSYFATDFSANGTFVNNKKIPQNVPVKLDKNDTVRIGESNLPWKNYFQSETSKTEKQGGQDSVNEIITVPSWFNILQRQAAKKARKKAGFKCRRFYSASVAVAVGYYYNFGNEKDLRTAVVMLENNSIDIAIIELGNGVWEIRSVGGAGNIGDSIDRIGELCSKALNEGEMNVDELILTGSAAFNPHIVQRIEKIFDKTAFKIASSEKLQAKGAGILNGRHTGKTTKLILLDVVPLSLGIETAGGAMLKIIDANTTVPVKKSCALTTAKDNQPSITVRVLEGEDEKAANNVTVGRFYLDGIPPAKKGTPKIEVIFEIDANGMLNVSAKDRAGMELRVMKVLN